MKSNIVTALRYLKIHGRKFYDLDWVREIDKSELLKKLESIKQEIEPNWYLSLTAIAKSQFKVNSSRVEKWAVISRQGNELLEDKPDRLRKGCSLYRVSGDPYLDVVFYRNPKGQPSKPRSQRKTRRYGTGLAVEWLDQNDLANVGAKDLYPLLMVGANSDRCVELSHVETKGRKKDFSIRVSPEDQVQIEKCRKPGESTRVLICRLIMSGFQTLFMNYPTL